MSDSSSSTAGLIGRVLQSVFFKRSQRRAGRLVRNATGMLELLKSVTSKSEGVKDRGFLDSLQTLSRMVRAYAKGQYKAIPWGTLVKITAALLYFVSPIDLIPDLLPVLGFTDDIALILWIIKSCAEDIERFKVWEASQSIAS